LETRYGLAAAVDLQRTMFGTVDEVSRATVAEGLDVQWAKPGSLLLARGPQHLPTLERMHAAYERAGLGAHFALLDQSQTEEHVRVAGALGSLHEREAATLHPGRLVRGLARVVERRGAVIYEQTRVTDFTTGAAPLLRTARGDVRAKTIVLCGEAYLSRLKPIRRQLIPVYSLITLTEPLSSASWAEIGWQAREGLHSPRYTVDYLTHTTDGRILFGGRGAPYHFGSRIHDDYDRHPPTHQILQDRLREWFPLLKDVGFTHTWGGPLGWPRDFMPTMSYDPGVNLASARGYTGVGVATSNLAGRVLADLINGVRSDVTELPCVNHRSRNWEPEPLRFLCVRYVQRAYERLDAAAERSGVPADGTSLAERLTSH
jgi:glycine/D-amino acid oxidase-like deaminating enzyme